MEEDKNNCDSLIGNMFSCFFDSLPDEICVTVFSFLTSFQLGRVECVCRRFVGLSRRYSLWTELYRGKKSLLDVTHMISAPLQTQSGGPSMHDGDGHSSILFLKNYHRELVKRTTSKEKAWKAGRIRMEVVHTELGESEDFNYGCPTGRAYAAAVPIKDQKMILYGGWLTKEEQVHENELGLQNLYIYNSGDRSWNQCYVMPPEVAKHQGQSQPPKVPPSTEVTQNDHPPQWQSSQPHESCTVGMSVLPVSNESILFYGGVGSHNRHTYRSNDVYLLDLTYLQWSFPTVRPSFSNPNNTQGAATGFPEPRGWCTGVQMHNGKALYYFGGGATREYNDVFALHRDEMRWDLVEAGGSLPDPVAAHCMNVLDDNSFVVFGGGSIGGNRAYNAIHLFDIRNNQWTEIVPQKSCVPPASRGSCHSILLDRRLIIQGGWRGAEYKGKYLNDVHMFNFDTLEWTCIKEHNALEFGLAAASSCFVGDSWLLFGGFVRGLHKSQDLLRWTDTD